MRRTLSCALLAVFAAAPATQATPIFGNGFEACCALGGTVSGLSGSGLVLRLSAGGVDEERAIAANGPYQFTSVVDAGIAYSVSVLSQPPSGPSCSISNASGVMPAGNVDNVNVSCADGLVWDVGVWGDPWQ
jgi:hypothetical protein